MRNMWMRIAKAAVLPLSFIFFEVILRAFNSEVSFFRIGLLMAILGGLAWGIVLYFLICRIPFQKGRRITGLVILCLAYVLTSIQYCCKSYFQTYFNINYMGNMTGDLLGDFLGTIGEVIVARIPGLLLMFLPVAVYIIFLIFEKRPGIGTGQPEPIPGRRVRIPVLLGIVAAAQAVVSLTGYLGPAAPVYTYSYSANATIPEFGLWNSTRLEAEYAVFGTPKMPASEVDDGVLSDHVSVLAARLKYLESQPVVYEENVTDIDFQKLADSTDDPILKEMDAYFGSRIPSEQNEYTGMMEGKNLITIVAEAFSPYCVDEKMMPTLYKLIHEGFVFTDYYQPAWALSTTGGEFSTLAGVIPTWYDGGVTPRISCEDYMPYTLGNIFRQTNYRTLAYHNNDYTFYNRQLTHPAWGFDFYGVGNGLEIESAGMTPPSDLDLFMATADDYIQEYLTTGQHFYVDYMTVSAHGNYSWAHDMAERNKEAALAAWPDYSEPVQAYLASSLELEKGMTYLISALKRAGIADETVIVLTADHYPYCLNNDGKDHYNELTGNNDTESDPSRFRNTFMLWCGDMEGEEPIIVDTPCSAIDIAPTLVNLFGITYDSRLYSGRDVFAVDYSPGQAGGSYPLAILPTPGGKSFETDAGSYDAETGVFTPREGVEVAEDYVEKVKQDVEARYYYAGLMIGKDYYGHVFGVEKDANAEKIQYRLK